MAFDRALMVMLLKPGYKYSRVAHSPKNVNDVLVLYIMNYHPSNSPGPDFDANGYPTNPCVKLLLRQYHDWMHDGEATYVDRFGSDVFSRRCFVVDCHNIKLPRSASGYAAKFTSWFRDGADSRADWGEYNREFICRLARCFPNLGAVVFIGADSRDQLQGIEESPLFPSGVLVTSLRHPEFVFTKIEFLPEDEANLLDVEHHKIARILVEGIGCDPALLKTCNFWNQNKYEDGQLLRAFHRGRDRYRVGEILSREARFRRGLLLASMSVAQLEYVAENMWTMRLWAPCKGTSLVPDPADMAKAPKAWRTRMRAAIFNKQWMATERRRRAQGLEPREGPNEFIKRALLMRSIREAGLTHPTWFKPLNKGGYLYKVCRTAVFPENPTVTAGLKRGLYSRSFSPPTKRVQFLRAVLPWFLSHRRIDKRQMSACMVAMGKDSGDGQGAEFWMPEPKEIVKYLYDNRDGFVFECFEVDTATPLILKISEFGKEVYFAIFASDISDEYTMLD